VLKIKKIKIEQVPVYDITVPETDCFFANDILVHNCTEIALMSDQDHTFACVLSSMNATLYDEWKDTNAVFDATVFLDCVNQDLIEIGKRTLGMEKVVRFAEKSRAIGLGVLGFHTYLQDHMIAFESIDAFYKNTEIFKHLSVETLRASSWMAEEFGEPEWCIGYGVRNTHRAAIAPNLCVTADTKIVLADDSIIDYETVISNMGIDYESLLSYTILLDDGTTRTMRYDDTVTVMRNGLTINTLVCKLKKDDDILI
jgi:hypothetical protein